jgi:hypothetical protein
MATTFTRTTFAIAIAAPALLFLGAGSAQARSDVSERGVVAIIDNLPTPRDCGSCHGFDPGSTVGIGNPNDLPPARQFNPQPDPPSISAADKAP